MRDPEANIQAEERRFKEAAHELHAQGAPGFSVLDVAVQIAIENKRMKGWRSLGSRVLQAFRAGRSDHLVATNIESGMYFIAGRLQDSGALEPYWTERESEGRAVPTGNRVFRLVEEPETL